MADAGAGSLPGGDSALPPPPPPPPPEEQELSQRLRRLYPAVNQAETPLPRAWSPKDKYNYIGLSQGNLRVHYKGHGKNHKDAASVRATHPIPAACGIYYFEVKIVSKGRDGKFLFSKSSSVLLCERRGKNLKVDLLSCILKNRYTVAWCCNSRDQIFRHEADEKLVILLGHGVSRSTIFTYEYLIWYCRNVCESVAKVRNQMPAALENNDKTSSCFLYPRYY
uniref:Uncharacterized protein n=1 Tax=Sphaerodactylus townsendi TaxID=933632 RepID=A0ACB8EAE7_9SAUR